MKPDKDCDGWCVEWCSKASGGAVNGLDINTVEYTKKFFTHYGRAQTYADTLACMDPSPVVLGEIAIHCATFAKHGRISRYWRIDDYPATQWVSVFPVRSES